MGPDLAVFGHLDETCRKALNVHLEKDCNRITKMQNLPSLLLFLQRSIQFTFLSYALGPDIGPDLAALGWPILFAFGLLDEKL